MRKSTKHLTEQHRSRFKDMDVVTQTHTLVLVHVAKADVC